MSFHDRSCCLNLVSTHTGCCSLKYDLDHTRGLRAVPILAARDFSVGLPPGQRQDTTDDGASVCTRVEENLRMPTPGSPPEAASLGPDCHCHLDQGNRARDETDQAASLGCSERKSCSHQAAGSTSPAQCHAQATRKIAIICSGRRPVYGHNRIRTGRAIM